MGLVATRHEAERNRARRVSRRRRRFYEASVGLRPWCIYYVDEVLVLLRG